MTIQAIRWRFTYPMLFDTALFASYFVARAIGALSNAMTGIVATIVVIQTVLFLWRARKTDRKRVAWHEAGHAAFAWKHYQHCRIVEAKASRWGGGVSLRSKTGRPRATEVVPGEGVRQILAKSCRTPDLMVKLAGIAVEVRLHGDAGIGGGLDVLLAEFMAWLMSFDGRTTTAIMAEALAETNRELDSLWPQIEAVAVPLAERGRLSEDELRAALGEYPL